MIKNIELGTVFGRLTVLGRAPKDPSKVSRSARWLCRCECGTEKVVDARSLRGGLTRSCGCFQKDRATETHTRHGGVQGGKSKEYQAWSDMKQRCDNSNRKNYKDYGGRGITYDPQWADFAKFLEDMGPCTLEDGSIERIDNDKNYTKDNCRWASKEDQMNNTRWNRKLTFNGETKSMSQWSRVLGITPPSLKGRIDRLGWTVEEALSTGKTRLSLKEIRDRAAAERPAVSKPETDDDDSSED